MALNCFVKPLTLGCSAAALNCTARSSCLNTACFCSMARPWRQGPAGSSLMGGELLWDYTDILGPCIYFMTSTSARKARALTCVPEFSGRLSRRRWGHGKQALCVSQPPTDAKCRLLSANSCSSPKGLSDSANPSPLPLGILFSDCLCCLVVRIYV